MEEKYLKELKSIQNQLTALWTYFDDHVCDGPSDINKQIDFLKEKIDQLKKIQNDQICIVIKELQKKMDKEKQ